MKRPMLRKKYGKKALALPPLAAFDFETAGLAGKFIIAAIVTSDNQRLLFYSLSETFDWMVSHPEYRYLAHNASGYEFAYLYPYIYDFFKQTEGVSIQPCLQGDTNIVQIKVTIPDEENPKKPIVLDLRDTLCLFSMSLEKVAKAFCPDLPKLKGNIDFEKDIFDIHNPDHIDYVFRDCDIVLQAYRKHAQNMQEVFGSPLGITAGSTAIKAFYTTLPEGKKYWRVNPTAEAFIRKCYYGGLVLPGRMLGDWGEVGSGDVNGAYAYQMKKHKYPVGNPARTCHYDPNRTGFYQVIATVPPTVFETLGFNPVPRRDVAGLVWPTGTFETFITGAEIAYAQEKGCSFEILDGYVFMKEEYVFEEFIDKCQEMELFDGGKYKPSIKQNRNSCYGKFGAKEEHDALVFSKTTLTDPKLIPFTNEKTGEFIEGLYTGKEQNDAEYMLPHWAAMITAYERLYLMRFIEEAYRRGAKNVYCDTDSIKCDQHVFTSMVDDNVLPVGTAYGEFKIEESFSHYTVLGPKCAYGVLVDDTEPPFMKGKGVPKRKLTPEIYTEALEAMERPILKNPKKQKLQEQHREVEFVSVESVMNIIKKGITVRPVKRKRKITDLRNSYSWEVQGKDVYPHGYLQAVYPVVS